MNKLRPIAATIAFTTYLLILALVCYLILTQPPGPRFTPQPTPTEHPKP